MIFGSVVYERGMEIAENKKHRLVLLSCAAWLAGILFLLPVSAKPDSLVLDCRPGRRNRSALRSHTILVDCGSNQQKSIGEGGSQRCPAILEPGSDASGSCGHRPGPGSHERDPVSSGTPESRNPGGRSAHDAGGGKDEICRRSSELAKKTGSSVFMPKRYME